MTDDWVCQPLIPARYWLVFAAVVILVVLVYT